MLSSTAWPLAALYALLVMFASLFPFTGWSWRALSLGDVLAAPLPPQYWTWFDVLGNLGGYAPLGFLIALGWLRTHHSRSALSARTQTALPQTSYPSWRASGCAVAMGAALSLLMEGLQMFLPHRVPSNLDWLLNTTGAALGALLAALLQWLGVVARWDELRLRWLGPRQQGGLTLLLLWPWALLFPAPMPFGLGQVLARLDAWLVAVWGAERVRAWLPGVDAAHGALPLPPAVQVLCMTVGLMAPVLLTGALVQRRGPRLGLGAMVLAMGLGATALSCALSYGPQHALVWLDASTQQALWWTALAAPVVLALPARWCALALLLALSAQLHWLNLAPASAYFAQTLQMWEQGRFIRFYGLGQWLGWLWPYAVIGWALLRLGKEKTAHQP